MATTEYIEHAGSGRFRKFASALSNGLGAYMERYARTDQINALNAKSDEELAARGIQRDDIVRYVYRDRFFM